MYYSLACPLAGVLGHHTSPLLADTLLARHGQCHYFQSSAISGALRGDRMAIALSGSRGRIMSAKKGVT